MVSDQVGRLAARKTATNQKAIDDNGASVYNARSSASTAKGSCQSGADAPRNTGGRLRSTQGGVGAQRVASRCAFGVAVSPKSRSVSAGASARVGRCVASGGERAGEAGRDGKRLEIATAVQALLEDGLTANQIRAELGLTKPRYYRILDRLGIPHSPALDGARRSRVELHDLGPSGWKASDVPETCGRGDKLLEIVHGLVTILRHEEQQEVEA